MYTDKRSRRAWWLAALVLVVLLVGFWALRGAGSSDEVLSREAVLSIKNSVERAALQCYAVEGAYPPDLKYLEDNYGLAVNTRDFYVRYDAFASNQPPTVRVEAKE